MTSLVWFRSDLRLADNPALRAAIDGGGAVIPIYIHAPEEESPWEPGGASRWWLHQSLLALEEKLRSKGSRLIIRRGPTLNALTELARETKAEAIYWNHRYEPAVIARDNKIKAALRATGLKAESFNAALLCEPWDVKNKAGRPFQVFTPFWRQTLMELAPPPPLSAPTKIMPPKAWPKSLALAELGLEPRIDWAGSLRADWTPGEAGAAKRFKRFLDQARSSYGEDRDRPDISGTSQLSPHLHLGEIGPRQIWHGLRRRAEATDESEKAWRASQFLTELGWREFAHHLLYHFPRTPESPLRENFKTFPWRNDARHLQAWQRGQTGYPIVDAGMRQLWATGWMHNRVRMIVASFLVKDLLLSWTEGARWFWDTLVDADLANNTLGWQWTAGCGADAAPYFRIFNPVSQGQKFDPDGAYVRRWCPELAKLPDKWIHRPFDAPPDLLTKADVELGRIYPQRLVSHSIAREVALEAFAQIH